MAVGVGVSLLDAGVTTIISGFADNMVPTVMALLTILVPIGITLWAIGFGVKKGLAFVQSKAKTAL